MKLLAFVVYLPIALAALAFVYLIGGSTGLVLVAAALPYTWAMQNRKL